LGADYERYALGKLLARLARKYHIKNVLEMLAHGVKAMPSIYSLGSAIVGCQVTLLKFGKVAQKPAHGVRPATSRT